MTAWRVCTAKPFDHAYSGGQLFGELCMRLGIAATPENAQQMREVALTVAQSPRYTSGCNPIMTERLQ